MLLFIYFISSYLIGSLMAGYFVVKLLGGKDIRDEGSGNVGARNAGRVHGKTSFLLTFLGDAMKGALIVIAGRYFGFPPEIVLTGLGFTILGHVKPITLNFKGGMGISTFIGGMLAFSPVIALAIVSSFIVILPFVKSFTFAGLGSFISIPFVLYYFGESPGTVIAAIILISAVIYVHRKDINVRLKNNKNKK